MKPLLSPPRLEREDIIEMEGLLCGQLEAFFSFSGHALYFPTEHAPTEPQLLSRERRLLLPLQREGRALGVLMLHGVRARAARALLPVLPAVTALCLDNLAWVRASRTDALTGLATEDVLFSRMEEAAARVRAHLEDPAMAGGHEAPLHRLCMGLVLVRLQNGPELLRLAGHGFVQDLLRALAAACRADLPSDVLTARVGRYEFAFLLAASGRGACHKLAVAALERMRAVETRLPLTRKRAPLELCAGHALYPQDMQGPEMKMPMSEQARRCMDRARLAADVAGQAVCAAPGKACCVMPFARILQEGGLVLENLPLGRVRVSLGRQAKAREGMRFALWDRTPGGEPRNKGEIVLLRARDTDAVGEIVHLADATNQPAPGDGLTLLGAGPGLSPDLEEGGVPLTQAETTPADGGRQERAAREPAAAAQAASASVVAHAAPAAGALPGDLCGHGDFLRRFAGAAEPCAVFTLALLRLETARNGEGNGPVQGGRRGADPLARALELWRAPMAGISAAEAPLAGLYGSNSLIFFHPGQPAAALLPAYQALCAALQKCGLAAAAGLAGYPFLRFRKAEMPDCALKALEYALLLPEPRAGVCNSLALNISADRRYSLGDVFGAVEEYKLALLADAGNVMAWNSLGVCMAALGRQHEARRHFLEALRHKPEPAAAEQVYYNLGTVCQSLGERRAAARYFRQCVKIAPEHLFAHIRLGQLCEQGGRRAEARRHYEQAAAIEDAHPEGPSVARRCLARVAVRQRRGGEARELLHEALVRNPQDAAAMLLLARIYLDGGEDPAIAEMLARKSAGLQDRPEAWQTLARALRALGREEEARVAEARAVLA
ncbi:tetratricopeptide repeat protein [Desulfovibrio legallii]|uniref:GGDEF domain-containing protein, diguanylate cyclase (C-di-GMP synthetase) or its enzymatically inactive variants n=1 Tax=Desulfovibrio legallii TaxID=571438 RepID=A0A1G7HZ23_9BACT|nr:GGDEF domain-containing protein, diguanylate cyclase (c-di-GMP synthetase) or its enzymatically inactive variants [Desulfovibrio legallii]